MGKGSNSFKLSDLLPNSWLYKLKNMRRRKNRVSRGIATRKTDNYPQIPTTEPPESPTIQHHTTNRISCYIPSSERAAEQLSLSPTPPKKTKKMKPLPSSSTLNSQPAAPAIPLHRLHGGFASDERNLLLPPVLTKPQSPLMTGRKQSCKQGSRSPSATHQIKLRIKSPRLAQRRLMKRKGLAESVVVVKSSSDPKTEFRESMVDMIVENRFYSWKELEELLACYLLLNSSEYHDLIVEVFEKIWFDLTEIIV